MALISNEILTIVLSAAGPVFSLLFLCATAGMGLQIVYDKSVKALSPYPFASLLVNSSIWTM